MRNLFLLILLLSIAILTTSCAPTVPSRPELKTDIPELREAESRLQLFMGSFESLDFNDIPWANGNSGNLYINDEPVGLVRQGEYILIDLRPGIYDIKWERIMSEMDMKKHYSEVKTLDISADETKLISANTRELSSLTAPLFGAAGMMLKDYLWVNFLDFTQSMRNDLRLVSYENLSGQLTPRGNTGQVLKDTNEIDNTVKNRLEQLKSMHDEGLINDEEYDSKKKALLDEL